MFKCSICGKEYESYHALGGHKSSHTEKKHFTLSDETKLKLSILRKGKKHAKWKISQNCPKKLYGLSASHKHNVSISLQGKHPTEETRQKRSISLSGEKNPMYGRTGSLNPFYGKHHTEETRFKISNNKERNRKIGIAHLGIHKPGKENAIKGATKISECQKKNWKNPEYSRKVLSKLCAHPNKPEALLLDLINIACPDQYKFTGDGTITISNLHPDYTNCNSQKKVIEMFGDYWHRGENPQDKIDRYANLGFDCLVLWEHEVKGNSKEELIETIRAFNKKTQRTSPWALPLGIRQAKPD